MLTFDIRLVTGLVETCIYPKWHQTQVKLLQYWAVKTQKKILTTQKEPSSHPVQYIEVQKAEKALLMQQK